MVTTNTPLPSSLPRRRQRLAKLLLLTAAVLMALLIAELALRIAGFTYFNPYIVDPDVGYTLRPGAEGWWKREGTTFVRINSHGFRDHERTVAKPPGTLRIAVLGDSFTEALQVPLEKTFTSLMEGQLGKCPNAGPAVEVLNFGVSGFSTVRELVLLRTRVLAYAPDIVVLMITTGNDIRDNSQTLKEYKRDPLPYYVWRDGQLVLDDSLIAERNRTLTFRLQQSPIGKAFNWLQKQSRVLGLIYTARESYQSSNESGGRELRQSLNEPGLSSEVYREHHSAEWEDAWRMTEALIRKMRDEVKAHGAKFLVVTGSMGIQVNPDAMIKQEFKTKAGIEDLFYPERRIKAISEREGIEVLTLAPALEEYARRNGVVLHGKGDGSGRGHWNELGHQLVSELVAVKLCQTIQEASSPP